MNSTTAAGTQTAQSLSESQMIAEAVASLRQRTSLEAEVAVPYEEIPHFPASTVEGHAGELVFGRLGKKPLVAMKGRVHYYEGYTMKQVAFPVRVMRGLGAQTLIISNAVGGLNPFLRPGDLVLVDDHINLMGDNPLLGPNDDQLGPRYPDMCEPYDKQYMELIERLAREERIPLTRGVFIGFTGPNLETRAEYRMARGMGADVVGMSLIPENLAAVHGSMKCLALSVVTDACLPDALKPANIEEILRTAAESEPLLTRLVSRFIEEL